MPARDNTTRRIQARVTPPGRKVHGGRRDLSEKKTFVYKAPTQAVATAEGYIRFYERTGDKEAAHAYRLKRAKLLGRLNPHDACAVCGIELLDPYDQVDVLTAAGDTIILCEDCVDRSPSIVPASEER